MFKKSRICLILCLAILVSGFMYVLSIAPSTSYASDATLADLWNGTAEWQLYYNKPINGSDPLEWHRSAGTSIKIVGSTWYWFQRYSPSTGKLGMTCAESTNQGLTWTAPEVIIAPTAGTPWAQMVTDGDFYYDSTANKWQALLQTLSAEGAQWQCCYFERAGADPMGTFTTPSGFTNPAISPKEIWSQIADNSNDHCVQLAGGTNLVFDEGTIDIVQKAGSTYTITFHGAFWANSVIHGCRGIATTTDFQNYTAAASDCIFDEYDSQPWNVTWQGGSIGVGASTTILEGSTWYSIVEAADLSLAGTEGQNWTMGLYKSSTLTNTNWERWPNNPISPFEPHKVIIEWQYPRLFKYNGVTYLAINKAYPVTETSFKIYKLVSKTSTATWTPVDDKSAAVTGSGTWYDWDSNPLNYNGTEKFSSTAGSYMQFTFIGTNVRWKGPKESNLGIAKVYIDGVLKATVDQYAATSVYQQILYSVTGLTAGQHTIKVVVNGTKNSNSSATNVVLDLFEFGSGTVPTPTPTPAATPTPTPTPASWVFEAEGASMSHQIGRADADGWSANCAQENEAFMLYGPYTTGVGTGSRTAVFRMMVDNNTADNWNVVRIEVNDATTSTILAQQNITRQQFTGTWTYQNFNLNFNNATAGHQLEFRVYWYDRSFVRADKITIN